MFGLDDKNKRDELEFYIKNGAMIIGATFVLLTGSHFLSKQLIALDVHNKKLSPHSSPLVSHTLSILSSTVEPWVIDNDLCTLKTNYSIENTGNLKVQIKSYTVEVFEIRVVNKFDVKNSDNNIVDFSISKLIQDARKKGNISQEKVSGHTTPKQVTRIYSETFYPDEVIGHGNFFQRSLAFVLKRDANKLYAVAVDATGGLFSDKKDGLFGLKKTPFNHEFGPLELRHVSNVTQICTPPK